MNPRVKISETNFEISLIRFPRHTVDAGSRITLQLEECSSQGVDCDVV